MTISRLDYTIFSILIGISAVFGGIYIALKNQLNTLSVKSFFIFLGLTFLWFILLSLTSLWYVVDARWNFFVVQFFSFLGGVLYCNVMFVRRDKKLWNFGSDVCLTIFLCMIGMVTYYTGYSMWSTYILDLNDVDSLVTEKSSLPLYASFACIPFIIPYAVRQAYEFYLDIPSPIFPKWLYPVGKEAPPFDYGDGDIQTKVNLNFSTRSESGEEFTRVTLIPNEMILGDFIHVYFDSWNANQENSRAMQLTDEHGRAGSFRFYSTRKDSSAVNKRLLDPNKTISFNKIQSEDTISIERESRYQ